MANLFYSEDGTISNAISSNVTDAVRMLNFAISECSMTVPNDFSCRSYLINLPSTISGFIDEIYDIYNTTVNIDSTMNNLKDGMIEDNHKIDVSVMKERERLIK